MKTTRKKYLLSAVLLLVGILLTVLGVLRGEAETVLEKATRVCMECIGIG